MKLSERTIEWCIEKDTKNFWEKTNKKKKGECWEWTGQLNGTGRGTFSLTVMGNKVANDVFGIGQTVAVHRGKTRAKNTAVLAHRYSYWLHNGSIDNSLFILHSCDNGSCVNPHHLTQGTQQENMRDMYLRKRSSHQKVDAELKELKSLLARYDYILKSICLNILTND
jgi:hypothetical protein